MLMKIIKNRIEEIREQVNYLYSPKPRFPNGLMFQKLLA